MRWIFALLLLATPAQAAPPDPHCTTGAWGQVQCIRPAHFVHDTCQLIEAVTQTHGLDAHFFTRLIWQESRFNPNALSPANAMGIAQFIRSTATRRGLKDPYNPADALDRSAQYLAELVARFGNEGMAAVAYNGGEARAAGFLEGRGLARETINYVPIITGLSAEVWRDAPPKGHEMRLSQTETFRPACYALARKRQLTPLVVPSRFAPWGVQVGYGRTKREARASYQRLGGQCRGLVGGIKMEFVPVKNRVSGRQGFLMARLARPSRAGALELCRKMRRQNCVCRVYRNP